MKDEYRSTLNAWNHSLDFVSATIEMLMHCDMDELGPDGFQRAQLIMSEALLRLWDVRDQIEAVRANGGLKAAEP